MPDDIRLVLLGEPSDLDFTELEPVTSPLTLKPLRRISVEMRVGAGLHDQLRERLNASRLGNLEVQPVEDADGGLWAVEEHHAYQDNGPWEHSLTFRQHDAVEVRKLEFADLSLVPEKAKVDRLSLLQDEGFMVEALVTVDAEQHGKLTRLITEQYDANDPETLDLDKQYLPVRLVGVRDEPLSMRFGGRCPWQSTDNGGARYLLVLVTEEGDPRQRSMVGMGWQPRAEALTRNSVIHEARIDALIAELQRAGVLSAEAVARIAEAAAAKPTPERWREYMRTQYLDDFFPGDDD
ncbi:hypothetical protein M8C17_19865 [Micromonospora sp. RHAY321]|uniref:hypothetical protein n=1 Tax=Micromonospora sp. RHAY321 TaxID=2944807 RepID=UPI00207C4ED7|nr:hypothetical protein [Micromonospora sp. RHAY321]MCO1597412.1 hypothetical protein [Micromonospora sp. RHAY321]